VLTVASACHVAHLDPMTGQGLLVLPRVMDDVAWPLGSLHEADWTALLARLRGMGWTLSEEDDGGPLLVGETVDGRGVLGLYGLDPITSHPTLEECIQADLELCVAAGLVPGGRRGDKVAAPA
jgi:hypothetical protein